MKKRRRLKLLSFVLSVVMLLAMLPVTAMAATHDYGTTVSTDLVWSNGDVVTSHTESDGSSKPSDHINITGDVTIKVSGNVTLNTCFFVYRGNTLTIEGVGDNATLTLKGDRKLQYSVFFGQGADSSNEGYKVVLKNITIAYESVTEQPKALYQVPSGSGSLVFENVTMKDFPDNFAGLLYLQYDACDFEIKNSLKLDNCGTKTILVYPSKHSPIELNNFSLASDSQKVSLQFKEVPKTDPTLIATGAKSGDESKFEAYDSSGSKIDVYYLEDKLYMGTTAPTPSSYKVELSTPSNTTKSGGDLTQNVTPNQDMTNVVFTADDNHTFKDANISALTNALSGTGLSATVSTDGKTLTISGTPTKAVDLKSALSGITLTKLNTVNLGALPTGLTLVSGDLTQKVVDGSDMTDVVVSVSNDYIVTDDYMNSLNSNLSGTGLAASYNEGTKQITISGRPTSGVALASWGTLTAVEAVIGDNKYATLADALAADAQPGNIIEMKKNPSTEVEGATLKMGVQLKDTNGNRYVAGENTTIDVSTSGEVTLNSGKLEAREAADATTKPTVKVDDYTVKAADSSTKAFVVEKGAEGTPSSVSINANGGSVENGKGLTFTAGAEKSTFPLDGSKLSKDGDKVKVSGSYASDLTVALGDGEGALTVTVPGSNTGDVTVTKGEPTGYAGKVTIASEGGTFKLGDKTYKAGSDDTEFAIKADGTVELVKGALALADGESFVGTKSGKEITNPASSGNDSVTIGVEGEYDVVTIPAGTSNKAKIGDKEFTNASETDPLVLKVGADGEVLVKSGSMAIGDGSSIKGGASGATIKNPAESGNDNVTVKSDGTKDTVTVPAGTDKKVVISKGTDSVEYDNASTDKELVIEIGADGKASLGSGSVKLDKNEAVKVNGTTITNPDIDSMVVTKEGTEGSIKIPAGGKFSATKDGETTSTTYKASTDGDAEFGVDAAGNIVLKDGKVEVEGGKSINVKNPTAGGDDYTVSGDNAFDVTGGANPTVTIPTKGQSVSNGNGLTFKAGTDGSVFPLDGSKLSNNGDEVTVGAGTNAEIALGDGADATKVKVPAGTTANTGNVTVTKGQPTIVKLDKNGDTFKVGDETYTADADGAEFVIDENGNVSKVEAKLIGADGNMKNAGSVASMIEQAANGETVSMVANPGTAVENAALKNGATLKDMSNNTYKAAAEGTTIDVATSGDVTLKTGKLDVSADGEVGVKEGDKTYNVESNSDPKSAYTVEAGSDDKKATVSVATAGGKVTNGNKLTFTAGSNGATFPLDGSKLTGNGDALTVAKDLTDDHTVALGDGANAPAITVPKANTGDTTITKGQPAGFVGKVALEKKDDKFTVGEGENAKEYKAASDDTEFAIDSNNDVTLVKGSADLANGVDMDVRANGWTNSVSVKNPNNYGEDIKVTASSPQSTAEVKKDASVEIGGKTYKALADTTFEFDQNGKVTVKGGKTELAKGEEVKAGTSKAEIKNTSNGEDTKVTVETKDGKDTITIDEGGKATINGKEYTNTDANEKLVIELDAEGKATLKDGKAEFGKDASLGINGATIKNTGNGALALDKNSDGTGTIGVKENGSFTAGKASVEAPTDDMSFTVKADGSIVANLPEGESVTINGVKYTAATGSDAKITIDPSTGKTIVEGNFSFKAPGADVPTYVIGGKTVQETPSAAPVLTEGKSVKLTQGNGESITINSFEVDASGDLVTDVPNGTYNIVVSGDGKTMTKLIDITNGTLSASSTDLPTQNVSSIVEVTAASPVGAMVGNLDAVAVANASGSSNVKITLTVDNGAENTDIAALEAAKGKQLMNLELTLEKKVDNVVDSTFSNSKVLEIILTFNTSNKRNITVFRKHSTDAAEELTKVDARITSPVAEDDGKYYVGNGYVAIYTSKFSPYAIGYTLKKSSSDGGAGGGGGAIVPNVNVDNAKNGTVTVSPKNPAKDDRVTITVNPDAGYELGKLTVTDSNGKQIELTKVSDNVYTFYKPNGKVNVNAEFVKVQFVDVDALYNECAKDFTCPITPYNDAQSTAWYHDGVHYCIDNDLMSGYSDTVWGPSNTTPRSQIVMILWRLNGCPAVDYAMNFKDVKDGEWYTEAVRWAASKGIVSGYDNGNFGVNDIVTREQLVSILYRYAQSMGYDVSADGSARFASFADSSSVSGYAVNAVKWACGAGILNGKEINGALCLAPQGGTTRAEMATLMMKFCTEIVK